MQDKTAALRQLVGYSKMWWSSNVWERHEQTKNCIHEETEGSVNSGNSCYRKFKIYRHKVYFKSTTLKYTTISFCVLTYVESAPLYSKTEGVREQDAGERCIMTSNTISSHICIPFYFNQHNTAWNKNTVLCYTGPGSVLGTATRPETESLPVAERSRH